MRLHPTLLKSLRWAGATCSGLLLALCFAPWEYSNLVWIALLPLVWAVWSLPAEAPRAHMLLAMLDSDTTADGATAAAPEFAAGGDVDYSLEEQARASQRRRSGSQARLGGQPSGSLRRQPSAQRP